MKELLQQFLMNTLSGLAYVEGILMAEAKCHIDVVDSMMNNRDASMKVKTIRSRNKILSVMVNL